jgi:hypothetical protein
MVRTECSFYPYQSATPVQYFLPSEPQKASIVMQWRMRIER